MRFLEPELRSFENKFFNHELETFCSPQQAAACEKIDIEAYSNINGGILGGFSGLFSIFFVLWPIPIIMVIFWGGRSGVFSCFLFVWGGGGYNGGVLGGYSGEGVVLVNDR